MRLLPAEEPREDLREERPRTRGDCKDGERPCPWLSCKYHLALEVGRNGSIKVLHPDANGEPDLDAMPQTCALDVADEGGVTLERVGQCLNVTREMVRLNEVRASVKLRLRMRRDVG